MLTVSDHARKRYNQYFRALVSQGEFEFLGDLKYRRGETQVKIRDLGKRIHLSDKRDQGDEIWAVVHHYGRQTILKTIILVCKSSLASKKRKFPHKHYIE
jgi:hypothetical protein